MKPASRPQRLALLATERERLQAHLRDRYPAERRWRERARELRRVAIVVGSPRGGTSVVHHLLRSAAGAVAPLGEHRPLFTLAGWNFPDATRELECIEDMPLAPGEREALLDEIAFECWGEPNLEPSAEQRLRFAWSWALRFQLQWPDLGADLEWVAERVEAVVAALQKRGIELGGENVTAAALRALLDSGVPLDPHLYALADRLRRDLFTDVPESGPPRGGTILEIPPFLAAGPRHRPRPATAGTLVLKASSDAHRLPTLRRLFAGRQVHWLHLTRNPLAVVNGLLDGWAHRGFWQHDLTELTEPGIAHAPRDRHLWCFDLFPGWREHLNGSLDDLCLEQWLHPHSRILTHLGPEQRVTRVRFEEFLAGGRMRTNLLVRMAEGLGLTSSARYMTVAHRPAIINATVAPAPARWLSARPGLLSLLSEDRVAAMAVRLGYTPKEAFEWD